MDLAIDKFDKRRLGLITGSACSVLFPEKESKEKVGQKTYAKQLAIQKYFNHYDEVSTWQIQHGNYNEHEAYTYYQDNYDFSIEKGHFEMVENWGGTSDSLSTKYGLDFKCPTSLTAWLDYLYVGISKQQWHQAQMYMMLFKKDLWKICAYLTETEFMIQNELSYPVPVDKRMIIVDIVKDLEWENKLRENTPFVISEREKYFDILCKQFGEK